MSKAKILICEDEGIVAESLRMTLIDLGYEITAVTNTGEDAIKKVQEETPDLILMDIVLKGGMFGTEAAEIIRSQINIPIIFLTAYSDEDTLEKAKASSPFGYLIKPFEDRELYATVEMALQKNRMEKKIEHLNMVLHAVRNVNKLIISEKNPKNLIKEACQNLIKTRGYKTAWILIFDETMNFDFGAEEGIGDDFGKMTELVKEKNIPECLKNILINEERIFFHSPFTGCEGCPIFEKHCGNSSLMVKLESGNKLYGILSISLLKDTPIDEEELSLIAELSEDIAFALYTIGNEEKRKIAVKQLAVSEKRYKDIFDLAPVGIYQSNREGVFLTANNALAKMLGYDSPEELMRKNIDKDVYLSPQQRLALIKKTLEAGVCKGEEIQWKKKDGTLIWIQLAGQVVKDQNGVPKYFEGFARDITEKKKADEDIRKLLVAVEQSPASIIVTDLQGNIEYANPYFCKSTGYTEEEIIGKNPRFLNTGELSSEYFKNLWETITSGKEWKGEFHNRKKNGEHFWEYAYISPIVNDRGETTHYLAVKEDITELKLKEAELIIAKENAERSNRLKTEFLAQMSHEIRTPLNSMLTFVALIREEFEDKLPQGLEQSFTIIDNSAKRLIRTIELILNMAEIQTGNFKANFEKIDLNEDILEDMLLEFHSRAKEKKLEIKYEYAAENTNILGDHYTVSQTFVNLIDNAVKYTHQGEVVIKLYNSAQGDICVDIKDSGIGISEEYLPHVFSPFSQEDIGYTRRFEGTGLGLALVKKYVELNGADISVKSEKGKGTTFTVTFRPANNSN